MIGMRVRNRSGSTDTDPTIKRIEQRAIQSRGRRKMVKRMGMKKLIELYSPTPEEEHKRMIRVAQNMLPERLMSLGAFPETLISLDAVSVYLDYSSENTLFFSVSYYDQKEHVSISLPMVKVVMKKEEETGSYSMDLDPAFVPGKDSIEKSISALHNNGIWDNDSIVKTLLRRKSEPIDGQGSKFTDGLSGARVTGLFLRK
jgi:hypothetical protein